jgi:hypothetical protein
MVNRGGHEIRYEPEGSIFIYSVASWDHPGPQKCGKQQ